jgi:hypothetical protein
VRSAQLLAFGTIALAAILFSASHSYAQDSFLAVGGFVGEPSGISVKFAGDTGAYVLNAGWSERRDRGPDVNFAVQFHIYESKKRDRVYTVWNLGPGVRITFFRDTEYSVLAPGGVSFIFPGAAGRHEVHFDAGPSIAVSPNLITSLYAVAGYRVYL